MIMSMYENGIVGFKISQKATFNPNSSKTKTFTKMLRIPWFNQYALCLNSALLP